MHRLSRAVSGGCLLGLLMWGCGCTPVQKKQTFAEILPAAPEPHVNTGLSHSPLPELPPPPEVKPALFLDRMPAAPLARLNLPHGEMADRLAQAELAYLRGERFYRLGDPERARQQFELAFGALLDAPEGVPGRDLLMRKIEELSRRISRFDVDGLAAGPESSPDSDGYVGAPLESIPELTFPVDPKLKEQVSELLKATVSQLPLELNDAVLGYISYFSSGRGRSTLLAGAQRSGRYRRMISRILDEEGVPQELMFLAQAESAFHPRARSHKGATGIWQFMKFRGAQYGLFQTRYHDDRMDPEKSTRAAARHLRDLYHQFGDWYLAMAAYNCGPVAVARAVERTGYADFWELRRLRVLPRETANYVPIILAMAIVSKQPTAYGLPPFEYEPALEYDAVRMDAPTNLGLIADVTGESVDQLKSLNPALLGEIAPAGYEVRVPKGSVNAVAAAVESVPEEKRASWRAHRVEEGDTLAGIAARYRVNAAALKEANRLVGSFDEEVEAGDLLLIPAASSSSGGKSAPKKSTRAARRRG